MSKNLTASQRQAKMTKMLLSKQGRNRVAAEISEPLRQLRDYESVGRRAFQIDPLPDGALPIYDKDVETPAFVVGEEGRSIQRVIHGERIMIAPFEIASNPTIPFTQVKERRFDVLNRIKTKTRSEIFRKEDSLIFQSMDAATATNPDNPLISVTAANFNIQTMADAFAEVEKHDHFVDKVFMNAKNYKMLRNAGRDYLDPETQRELLKTGLMGELWGAQVYTSREVPEGSVFVVTSPEYFGVMPVRIDLTVISADRPELRSFGWSIFESIGIGITNTKGIVGIKIT